MPGHAYLVTFATRQRRPHFANQVVAFDACRWLAADAAWRDAKLLAWILMPDHWHGILQLEASADLAESIGAAKGRVARGIRAKYPHLGGVWQDGFHDQIIRGEHHLRQAARYIVMNPVRAGLVKRVGDYPYWDAMWLSAPIGNEVGIRSIGAEAPATRALQGFAFVGGASAPMP